MDANNIFAILASVAAGIAGLIYIGGKIRRGFIAFEAAAHLIRRELSNNGGSSIKDAVQSLAKNISGINDRLDKIEKRLVENGIFERSSV